jgi:AAA15 family ATPase/GTPase
VADVFSEYGLRVVLKPQESKIEVKKEIDDVIISYPYALVSDTLQRVVFHLVAIETNEDSVIIFEEPEAHAFPYYTKFLAERISLDKTNQYFISTHNPYFLLSVLEKTPKDDIGIFITYLKDYQTNIRPLVEEDMPEILELDASVFFNLDRFLEE